MMGGMGCELMLKKGGDGLGRLGLAWGMEFRRCGVLGIGEWMEGMDAQVAQKGNHVSLPTNSRGLVVGYNNQRRVLVIV